jgi:hypothetical protein
LKRPFVRGIQGGDVGDAVSQPLDDIQILVNAQNPIVVSFQGQRHAAAEPAQADNGKFSLS